MRPIRILLALSLIATAGVAVAAPPKPATSIGGPVKKDVAVSGKIILRHH